MTVLLLPTFREFMLAPPFVPQAYWNAVSNEQRIKHLFATLHRLMEYTEKLSENQEEINKEIEKFRKELDEFLANIEARVSELENEVYDLLEERLQKLREELINLIEALEKAPGWNVQTGEPTDAATAARIARKELYNNGTVSQLRKLGTVDNLKIAIIPGGASMEQFYNIRVDQLSTRMNSIHSIWNLYQNMEPLDTESTGYDNFLYECTKNCDFYTQFLPVNTQEEIDACRLSYEYKYSIERTN